jgi:hypothetical protein
MGIKDLTNLQNTQYHNQAGMFKINAILVFWLEWWVHPKSQEFYHDRAQDTAIVKILPAHTPSCM